MANLTRDDGESSWSRVTHPASMDATPFALEQANEALATVRDGRIQGAAVLVP